MTKRKNDDDDPGPHRTNSGARDDDDHTYKDAPDLPVDETPITVTEHDDLEAQAQARKDEAAQRGRPE